MSKRPLCFVVMPFRPELNFFYLYIQRHLSERHSVRVERGDHKVLTKPLMEKIREQIVESDVVIADISGGNPNVFYEVGLAHALGRPVIFLTSDDPKDSPVDVGQFEYIVYQLQNHEDFLSKLDNAIQHVFVGKYQELHGMALEYLAEFNAETASSFAPTGLAEFQALIMHEEQTQEVPPSDQRELLVAFLLPKIVRDPTDLSTMRKITEGVSSKKK